MRALPGKIRRGQIGALFSVLVLAMPLRHGADMPQGGGEAWGLGRGLILRLRGGRGSSGAMGRLRSACSAVESGRAELEEVWR